MKKAETDQKYEEMDLKFEETDQQIEIFKVFGKSGNGSKKKEETDQKFEGTDQKYGETELKTLEWDILNPDRIINLEIKTERRTSNI